jgi:hypothetical protein
MMFGVGGDDADAVDNRGFHALFVGVVCFSLDTVSNEIVNLAV